MKIHGCSFWADPDALLQWMHNSHHKQQCSAVFVAHQLSQILDATDVPQWKRVRDINRQ